MYNANVRNQATLTSVSYASNENSHHAQKMDRPSKTPLDLLDEIQQVNKWKKEGNARLWWLCQD